MKKYIIMMLIVLVMFLTSCTLESGSSTDYIYGYDKGIVWGHAYLKDDHTTCYCFNDDSIKEMFEYAQTNNVKLKVNYERYLIKGSLCSCGDKMSTVIVTKVEVAE